MNTFNGKVAMVTGGGSGLGEAIGKAVAAKGGKVVLTDINARAAERVATEIVGAGGAATFFQQDTANLRIPNRLYVLLWRPTAPSITPSTTRASEAQQLPLARRILPTGNASSTST